MTQHAKTNVDSKPQGSPDHFPDPRKRRSVKTSECTMLYRRLSTPLHGAYPSSSLIGKNPYRRIAIIHNEALRWPLIAPKVSRLMGPLRRLHVPVNCLAEGKHSRCLRKARNRPVDALQPRSCLCCMITRVSRVMQIDHTHYMHIRKKWAAILPLRQIGSFTLLVLA